MTAYHFSRVIAKDQLAAVKLWNSSRIKVVDCQLFREDKPNRNGPYLMLNAPLDRVDEYRWRIAVDHYLDRRIWVEFMGKKRFKRLEPCDELYGTSYPIK